MKNEYDALNRAVMDLGRYEEEPLDGEMRAALAAMLHGKKKEAAAVDAPRRGRRRWAVLAVAAALACCALGAGAASRFEWGRELVRFLGMEQSEAETLGVPGVGLGLTKALGGGTVTLEGVLGDDHCVYIPLRVELPQGTKAADDGYGFDRFTLDMKGEKGSGMALVPLAGQTPGEGTIRFLLMANIRGNMSGKTVNLTLGDLFAYPCKPEEHRQNALMKGSVEFEFTLDYDPQAAAIPVPAGKEDVGAGTKLEKMELSPLSLCLEFQDGPRDGFDSSSLLEMPIALHFADGTALALLDSVDGTQAQRGMRYAGGPEQVQLVCQFGRVIDPAAVESVEVNGVLFPVR
ncbi:hypothetical protein [Allofournierella sp.]|uniref:hypothetical protein n=1 Tax=Allofournierella sp. TaxID=1940256 RepID=UPI003AB88BD0